MDKLTAGATHLDIKLDTQQLALFQTYYEVLIDWNRRINLTSITGYDEVQTHHFLDALTVELAWKPGSTNARVIDVGTGAGIPGLPLKIVFPQIQLVLLEATAKKAVFLRYVVEKLGLNDVEVGVGRAEDIARQLQYREQFNLVLCRAVAPLATLVELTLPFCKNGGLVIAHKKGDIKQELGQSVHAVDSLGGRIREVVPVNLPEFPDKRCLVVIEKVSLTPPQYPRRPGMPAKKPIR